MANKVDVDEVLGKIEEHFRNEGQLARAQEIQDLRRYLQAKGMLNLAGNVLRFIHIVLALWHLADHYLEKEKE